MLRGTFALALWPLPLLQVQVVDLPTPIVLGETMWYHHPGAPPLVATVLSQDGTVACVLPEGRDLPLVVSVSLLSYGPASARATVSWPELMSLPRCTMSPVHSAGCVPSSLWKLQSSPMAHNTSNNCELDLVTLLEYNQGLRLMPGSGRNPSATGLPQRPAPTRLCSGQWVGMVNWGTRRVV